MITNELRRPLWLLIVLLLGCSLIAIWVLIRMGAAQFNTPPPIPLGQIVFQSYRDGANNIYTINTDGSGLIRLTDNTSIDFDPAWSPDGSQIVFVSWRDGNRLGLYTMNANGSNVTAITQVTTAEGFIEGPDWSPDGTQVAYRGGKTEGIMIDANSDGIFILELSTSAVTQLTNGPDYYPQWSPDGSQIAFVRNYGGGVEGGLYIINADGTGITRVSDEIVTNKPAWSPNGQQIVFPASAARFSQLFMVDLNSQRVKSLTDYSDREVEMASWSPDGNYLVVVFGIMEHPPTDWFSEIKTQGDLYLLPISGGVPIELVIDPADDTSPDWHP